MITNFPQSMRLLIIISDGYFSNLTDNNGNSENPVYIISKRKHSSPSPQSSILRQKRVFLPVDCIFICLAL